MSMGSRLLCAWHSSECTLLSAWVKVGAVAAVVAAPGGWERGAEQAGAWMRGSAHLQLWKVVAMRPNFLQREVGELRETTTKVDGPAGLRRRGERKSHACRCVWVPFFREKWTVEEGRECRWELGVE